ncbi:MAG: ferrous iron transport protein B [Brevinematales bacterium]
MKKARIALVGNPNCGKTTLFNLLTGSRQHVGNWPGVTVEKKEGSLSYEDYDIEFIDLPGTYSLSPNSIEEKITRNFIVDEKPDIVLNVIDGTTLERSMYLTTQIIDTGVPFILAVNMYDEVMNKGLDIDLAKMEILLKAPVVMLIASREEGAVPLLKAIIKTLGEHPSKKIMVNYGEEIEQAISDIMCSLAGSLPELYDPRWLAIQMIQQDRDIIESSHKNGRFEAWEAIAEKHVAGLRAVYKEDPDDILSEKRYGFILGIIRECVRVRKTTLHKIDITEAIDTVLLNKYLSFPIFALILWLTFQMTFLAGGFFSYWITRGTMMLSTFIHQMMPSGMLKDLMTDGIISGVGSVLAFLPQIIILFLIVAILEDSGYMARVAFIMDRMMHLLGVHGKSFISLFMGVGCNVPGIMAARTLENDDDRKVTVLINPFMSCSARLPIYILIAGMFFGKAAGTVIFSLYFLGILVAIGTAKFLKIFFFRNKSVPFVMELPPYRTPTLKSLLIHMWERSSQFLQKMGGVILVGSILIWVLGYFPRTTAFSDRVSDMERVAAVTPSVALYDKIDAAKSAEQIENSYIGSIGKWIEPFFKPLGFGWKEGVALMTGVIGKEIVVSTISVLYETGENNSSVLRSKMTAEGMTVTSALGFLVFVLLYIPCLATISAVLRETNSIKWTIFSVFYGIGIGYLLGFAVNYFGKLLY